LRFLWCVSLIQKRERRSKGALSMIDNKDYRKWMEKYGLDDINEILSKNDYQSPEESDPENDPNAPVERKKVLVYKLAWRSEKVIGSFIFI
jgi:hypothetical protein